MANRILRRAISCYPVEMNEKMPDNFAGLSGVENMHTDQRRNRALVWHDLFGDNSHFKFHANRNEERF